MGSPGLEILTDDRPSGSLRLLEVVDANELRGKFPVGIEPYA